MNEIYNPDPAHPPSMTPHQVAMQVRAVKQAREDLKDWALSLLRRSSVTNWADPIEYARWVRSVACAAADGKERWLEELELEFCERQRASERRETQTHNTRIS